MCCVFISFYRYRRFDEALLVCLGLYNLSPVMRNPAFTYAKTNTQISFTVTAKLISAFVFAIRIVQSLYYLNPKFFQPLDISCGCTEYRHPLVSVRTSVRRHRPPYSKIFFSKTAWPIKTKFQDSLHWKVIIKGSGHITKMTTTTIYGNNRSHPLPQDQMSYFL